MILVVEPPATNATAIDVADPHVSLPTGTSEKARENVADEPSLIVKREGCALALGSLNRMGLLIVGRSTVADGKTAPLRSCSVNVGHPLIVQEPAVFLISVILA